jgi:hypothetical protein
LDAPYPDVVQMLTEAAAQNNLPGRFAHDALPEAGRMYERPATTDGVPGKSRKTRVGRDHLTPNLFPLDPSREQRSDDDELAESVSNAMANVTEQTADASDAKNDEKPREKNSDAPGAQRSPSSEKKASDRTTRRWPTWFTPRVHRFAEEKSDSEPSPQKPAAKPRSIASQPEKSDEQKEPK